MLADFVEAGLPAKNLGEAGNGLIAGKPAPTKAVSEIAPFLLNIRVK
jgi:hypothetical protein